MFASIAETRSNTSKEILHCKSGIEAYVRLCNAWCLDRRTSAKMILVDDKTWDLMAEGDWRGFLDEEQKLRIGGLFELYDVLHQFFGEPIADMWVTKSNYGPLFHGKKPIQVMIEEGLPAIVEVYNYVSGLIRR